MPQSRHRKIARAKKRPKGSGPLVAPQSSPTARKDERLKIIAMVISAAILLTLGYLLVTRRGGNQPKEVTTASGLKYTDVTEGNGVSPQPGQSVTVNYVGTLENGTKFDSSYDHGQPYTFVIGRGKVIKGWDEGLMSMKVGGKRKLIVPSALGYGPIKQSNIPANSTLLFDVEMLSVK